MDAMASPSRRDSKGGAGRRVACGAAMLMLGLSTMSGQTVRLNPDVLVPARARVAAELNHHSFAAAIAAAGLSGGFVVSNSRDAASARATETNEANKTRLGDVLAAFRATHAGHDASIAEELVRIRPTKKNACTAVLSVPTGPHVIATNLRDGVQVLLHGVDASQKLPGPQEGFLGSISSRPEDPVSAPTDVALTVTLPRMSFENALNAIVASLPGTVWLLEADKTAEGESRCTLRIVRESGMLHFGANLAR